MSVSLIAALGVRTRVIGTEGRLPWRLPGDMKHFTDLTKGKPVVMGRKTWESIPEKRRPLEERTNIVITRDEHYSAPGALVCHSLDEALRVASASPGGSETMVIGGGEIYREALPFADRLYLTLVEDDAQGDALFPDYIAFGKTLSSEAREENGIRYTFVALKKP